VRSHIFEPVFLTVISMWLMGRRTGLAVTVVLVPLQELRAAGAAADPGFAPLAFVPSRPGPPTDSVERARAPSNRLSR
jgi:hypothetical protein